MALAGLGRRAEALGEAGEAREGRAVLGSRDVPSPGFACSAAKGWAALLHLQAGAGRSRVLEVPVGNAPSPRLTIFRLVQDVKDVGQLQRQFIRLLGHIRVHALDLGAVWREGSEVVYPHRRVTVSLPYLYPATPGPCLSCSN